MTDSPHPEESMDIITEIRAALGGRTPLTCWYISAGLIDQLPLQVLDDLTNEPSLFAEALRLNSGACLVIIMAARNGQDAVEEMLGALGALYGITPAEVV